MCFMGHNQMATVKTNHSTTNTLFKIVMLVAVIGALNWGLVGLFNWNLVDALFGGGVHEETSAGSRVVYALVGLAGLLSLVPLLSRRTDVDPSAHRA